jgi:hypothetical protein
MACCTLLLWRNQGAVNHTKSLAELIPVATVLYRPTLWRMPLSRGRQQLAQQACVPLCHSTVSWGSECSMC